MDTTQARALLAILVAAYPGVVLEPESAEVYIAALTELQDADTAQQVVHATIHHSPKFPPISDIVWSYRQMRNRPTGEHKQIEPAAVPPPPEAAAAIRELGQKWKVPALVEFAERYVTSDEESKVGSS